jgi:hypothetical protein
MRKSSSAPSVQFVFLVIVLAFTAMTACSSDDSEPGDPSADASNGDATDSVDQSDVTDTDETDADSSDKHSDTADTHTDTTDTDAEDTTQVCDADPDTMSDIELYEHLIYAWCERFIDCGNAGAGYTIEVCAGQNAPSLAWTRHQIERGVISVDREAAMQCLEPSCDGACHELDSPCHLDALDGTLELGESCRSSSSCKQGRCVLSVEDNTPVECSGTCTLSSIGCGGQTCGDDEYCHQDECKQRLDEGSTCDPFVNDICLEGLSCGPEDTCITPRSEGGTCVRVEDCAEGLVCLDSECSPPSQLGEKCGSNPQCADGLYCGDAGECVQRAPAGSTCFGDEQCLEEHRCHPLDCDPISEFCRDGLEGTCIGDQSAGEYCLYNDDCTDGLFCTTQETCRETYEDGETCSPLGPPTQCGEGSVCAGGLCSQEPDFTEPLPERGESCVPVQGLASACAGDLVCTIDDNAAELAYSCQDRKSVGGTCHRNRECTSGRCARDIRSAVGECLELLELGDSCGHPADCASGVCIDRLCVSSKRQLGEPCRRDAHCGEGLCHGGQCVVPSSVCPEWQ